MIKVNISVTIARVSPVTGGAEVGWKAGYAAGVSRVRVEDGRLVDMECWHGSLPEGMAESKELVALVDDICQSSDNEPCTSEDDPLRPGRLLTIHGHVFSVVDVAHLEHRGWTIRMRHEETGLPMDLSIEQAEKLLLETEKKSLIVQSGLVYFCHSFPVEVGEYVTLYGRLFRFVQRTGRMLRLRDDMTGTFLDEVDAVVDCMPREESKTMRFVVLEGLSTCMFKSVDSESWPQNIPSADDVSRIAVR